MIGAVVLAAGQSRRMGTQKLLLPLRGQPILALIADELLRTSLRPVVVVVGRNGAQIQSALAGREISFVANPNPNGDMLSSVRCGLRALPVEVDGVLVALGDQPGVTTGLIESLLQEFRRSQCGIVLPKHGDRRGHPLLLASRFREEILSRHDGVGLRGLLVAHPGEICEVTVSSPAELADLDTPEDYERLRMT